jgi:hypothetical protein
MAAGALSICSAGMRRSSRQIDTGGSPNAWN